MSIVIRIPINERWIPICSAFFHTIIPNRSSNISDAKLPSMLARSILLCGHNSTLKKGGVKKLRQMSLFRSYPMIYRLFHSLLSSRKERHSLDDRQQKRKTVSYYLTDSLKKSRLKNTYEFFSVASNILEARSPNPNVCIIKQDFAPPIQYLLLYCQCASYIQGVSHILAHTVSVIGAKLHISLKKFTL